MSAAELRTSRSSAAIAGLLVVRWVGPGLGDRWNSNLQPIASYFLPNGWSIGYSGNVLANWKEDCDDVWTLPIALTVAKLLKL